MGEIRGCVQSLTRTLDNKYLLTIEATGNVREMFEEMKDTDCDIKIKKHREKRSLNANSYLWVLCDRLAEKIGSTKIEIYRDAIRDVGIFKDFTLSPNEAPSLEKAWSMLGTGWLTERIGFDDDNVFVRCYYGSSMYNKRQMARLLDYIIQDCKNVGVETMTPEEIARLKAVWGE
jgi:hypothetical protein